MALPNTNVLPYELWNLISSFIYPQDKMAFYQICSATWDIGLNDIYSSVLCPPPRQFLRLLDTLVRAPSLSNGHRVRTLSVQPEVDFWETVEQEKSIHKHTVSRIHSKPFLSATRHRLSSMLQPAKTKSGSAADLSTQDAQLSHLFSTLTGVKTLRLNAASIRGDSMAFAYRGKRPFDLAWSAFHHSLHELDVALPLESLSLLLPSNELPFPSLRRLSITIYQSKTETRAVAEIRTVVSPFVQRFSPQLSSLSVTWDKGQPSVILENLPTASNLTAIGYSCPPILSMETDLSGLRDLLSFRAQKLKSLSLHFSHTSPMLYSQRRAAQDWHLHPAMCVPLPYLEELELDVIIPYDSPGDAVPTIRYVVQFRSSLVTLRLQGTHLTHPCFLELAQALAQSSRLRSLSVGITEIYAQTLVGIGEVLPCLDEFSIRSRWITVDQIDIQSYRSMDIDTIFANILRESAHRIQTWSLKALSLRLQFLPEKPGRVILKEAFLEVFPNTQLFSGHRRDDYLACDGL